MGAGYQSFLQKSTRTTYCSASKYKSHADAADWVARCLAANGNIPASDTKDYKYPRDSQPTGANVVIWP